MGIHLLYLDEIITHFSVDGTVSFQIRSVPVSQIYHKQPTFSKLSYFASLRIFVWNRWTNVCQQFQFVISFHSYSAHCLHFHFHPISQIYERKLKRENHIINIITNKTIIIVFHLELFEFDVHCGFKFAIFYFVFDFVLQIWKYQKYSQYFTVCNNFNFDYYDFCIFF
jgi:hypothetical protein